jgi:hypothetical protein
VLTVQETVSGITATVAQLHFKGTYSLASFTFAADASTNGTIITDPPAKITSTNTNVTTYHFSNAHGATETALLPAAGGGLEQITGFKLTGHDVLDLRVLFANAAGHPSLAGLGGYLTASQSAGNTTLYYDASGHGHGGAFATLEGVSTTVAGLLAHHALSLG